MSNLFFDSHRASPNWEQRTVRVQSLKIRFHHVTLKRWAF